MSLLDKLPKVNNCCQCIGDLKVATVIIAVLGIVTSPSVAWVAIRHAYFIRMTCFLTTGNTRPDIIDISLKNLVSFGLGANAGMGPACVMANETILGNIERTSGNILENNRDFNMTVSCLGWVVLVLDIVFVASSFVLLVGIFQRPNKHTFTIFLVLAIINTLFSFGYSMLYVAACVSQGGNFPLCELILTTADLVIWSYYIIVVNTYKGVVLRSYQLNQHTQHSIATA